MPPVLSIRELTALVAALMAINALSIDVMLPALPEIGRSFQIASANDRQLVVVAYVLAMGAAQLAYGPLADAFGRRRVLLFSLTLGLLGSLGCAVAPSFPMLLASRAVQGAGVASTRVISTALVRDLYEGDRMAQIISTAMMIFLIVPILAPGIGQLVLSFAPWRWLFAGLLFAFVGLMAWIALRLPETLPPERRIPVRLDSLLQAYSVVLRSRTTVGYTLALALVFASMFAFLTSSQQLFGEVFGLGNRFPLAFASVGGTLAIAQFANSRLVMRYGMRKLSHGAALTFAAITSGHAVCLALLGYETLFVFLAWQLPSLLAFSFLAPNFSAIAMQPMARVAGSAAALNGFVATVAGAIIGGLIGRAFDGSSRPFVYGQALLAVVALTSIVVTERGRARSFSS